MFKCTMCGNCCRNIGNNPLYAKLDNGSGVCRYLKGNLCEIYENRPLICRVDEGYEKFFSGLMSKEEYYKLNYEACEKLKSKTGGK